MTIKKVKQILKENEVLKVNRYTEVKARKLPFDCVVLDKQPVRVKNRFGGGSVMLEPDEVAVYDTIIGAESIEDYKTVRKGIDWFIKHNAEAYMVLLD